ncbi:copper resistance protein B [Caulobacter sp. SSI4214]|uniref:copper resistance protein B n=1 Tax=Caulobacter sp. SSI4214 TaxID=2575739 RepID=UPI0014387E34|nr:copper resistance protein B [Caulobacter sp. SSI4214]
MNRLALIALMHFAMAGSAAAQTMDHSSMPGMAMPATPATPAKAAKPVKKPAAPPAAHQQPAPPAAAADPQAGRAMPAASAGTDHGSMPGMSMPADPAAPKPAAMPGMDHGSTPGMKMDGGAPRGPLLSEIEAPKTAPPPPPADHVADRFFSPAAMAEARAQLRREHGGGGVPYSKVMADLFEYQARAGGADGYRWEGEAWFGGDIHRLVLKSEGEATRGEGVESAEVQALYSRAVGVYTDVQVGVRQDFEPRRRTYATVGFETLFPYWFSVEGAAFLSNKGELLGRVEGTYDLRLTNRVILQPRAELNFAAQDTRETQTGSGLSNAELGLRLRYEVRREFAPYVGISWDRQFGRTADFARARGADSEATSVVFGIRAFF